MKGLALVLSPKGPKGSPEGNESEPDEAPASESGGSERKYASLAAEAIAAGDTEAAADALVSMTKACMQAYGPK